MKITQNGFKKSVLSKESRHERQPGDDMPNWNAFVRQVLAERQERQGVESGKKEKICT